MLKKLMKYGNSHAILLNKSVLDLLGLSGGDSVKLTIQGETLLIKKAESITESDRVAFIIEENKQKKLIEQQQSFQAIQDDFADKLADIVQNKSNKDDVALASEIEEALHHSLSESNVSKSDKSKYLKAYHMQKAAKPPISMAEMLANKSFMEEWKALEAKRSSLNEKSFTDAALEIRYRYFPELRGYDLSQMPTDN